MGKFMWKKAAAVAMTATILATSATVHSCFCRWFD